MFIEDLGWHDYFAAAWNEQDRADCVPARVILQQRGMWRVAGEFGERWATASGKLRRAAQDGADWPAVGDWVGLELLDRRARSDENGEGAGWPATNRGEPTRALLQGVLPRRSRFVRKEAGKRIAEQVIAANVDTAVIVTALDGDCNLRRIERYMAQTWESGARPVVVLNKADACTDVEARAAAVGAITMGAPLCVVSAKTGQGMDALAASFRKGETLVFLGSSGVGKSTLVNRLLHEDKQATAAVRESDRRGRHTTTARELFVLPSGAMVIDTPGLRELQLWEAGEGVAETFADIEELAAQCRFRDCSHASEPGCAVRQALEEGALDPGRLESRRKLEREEEFLLRKMDPEKQHEYRKRIKILFRAIRQDVQSRNKDKQ